MASTPALRQVRARCKPKQLFATAGCDRCPTKRALFSALSLFAALSSKGETRRTAVPVTSQFQKPDENPTSPQSESQDATLSGRSSLQKRGSRSFRDVL